MKKIYMLILISFLLISCTTPKKTEEQPQDTLSLTHQRIQVAQNSTINYESYIEGTHHNVTYNTIDTSKKGTYTIDYMLNNDTSTKQTLTVDVVTLYDQDIFNPTEVTPHIVENPNDITVLVNKTNALPQDYQPNDLVKVIDSQQQLRKEAANAYQAFYNAAKSQGIACYAISGYRTYETQKLYWDRQCEIKGAAYASQYSAYPNRSEHQLGLAIDVSYKTTGDRLSEDVETSDIGQFIISDGYKYGFILRYPQDKISITNYGYEPWHIRYVGVELATYLHDNQLTLEEYKEDHP